MDWAIAAEAAGGGGGAASGGYWQLILILAGIGFLGLFARWRKAKAPPPVDTKVFRDRDQDPNRYRDAADRAIVELLETSRSLNAQVDTKIRVLNTLIKEAETQTARLEKLLAEARGETADKGTGEAAASQRRRTGVSGRGGAASPAGRTELQERIFVLRREGKSLPEIARATNLSTTEVRFALETMNMSEEAHG